MSSSNGVRLEQYTEKSIAVFGNTQPIKDKLKELGGKFNSNLRGQPGWIFVISARPRVEEYISTLPDELPLVEKPVRVSSSNDDIIQSLIARIEALEALVGGATPKPKAKPKVTVPLDEEEEEELRPKRLLRK
jgi:hypothetical protein